MADFGVPINPASGVEQRLYPSAPVTPVAPRNDGAPAPSPRAAPPTQLALGTTVEAIVRGLAPGGSAGALPLGTHLLLRIVAVPAEPSPAILIGRVVDGGGANETLVETPLGLLALQRRLALPPETLIAFERLEDLAPDLNELDPPSRAGTWPALDEAIATLAQAAPPLASLLRSELSPASGAQLAGTLLFILGALYQGDWPGAAIGSALSAAGRAKLAQRLGEDTAELRRLAADPATGEWRVLTLPLLAGSMVLPLRLFLRRRPPGLPAEEAIRFAIEVELSQFGPLQLDGLLRGTHLVVVLRSHRSLPESLRAEASAACRNALAAWGLTGDLSFTTAAHFALTPLSNLRKHIEVSV